MKLDSGDELPLVGPRAHERAPSEPPLTDIRLRDGTPVYHLFLDNPEAAFIEPNEVHDAKSELLKLAHINEDKVRSCQGKTAGEARAMLESIGLPELASGEYPAIEHPSVDADAA